MELHTARVAGLVSMAALTAVSLALTGCSPEGGGGSDVVEGATLTIAIDDDPGNLDPQRSLSGVNKLLGIYAYDTPVSLLNSGEVTPQVVSAWEGDGTEYVLTVRDDVTCSDGTPLDAQTVADNINWVGDAANGSAMTGASVPAGTTATAAGDQVTVTLTSGAPFFMQNLAELPLVCSTGMEDRDALEAASLGSGPFVLDKITPGDSIEYVVREGYNWGPNGASTDAEGTPARVVFKIVTSGSTITSMLLSKQVNIARVTGADTERVIAENLFASGYDSLNQEITFNQAEGEPTADIAVRQALVAAINLTDAAEVATAGLGRPANGLLTDPKICAGDTVSGIAPAFDPAAAAAQLEDAGWVSGPSGVREKDGSPLEVAFVYDNEDPGTAATAEYIAEQWTSLGASVALNGTTFSARSAIVFGGEGPWTATLIGLGVGNPATLVPFFSGPTPTDGINYGSMNNEVYNESVTAASDKPGTEGCDDWITGEKALIADADIVPIAVVPVNYYGNGAEFDVQARVLWPTSLRATE